MTNTVPLLQVNSLCKYFPIYKRGFLNHLIGHVKAVDNISFNVMPGEILGLVGESGSGKTTAARSILRAIQPTSGKVVFNIDNSEKRLDNMEDNQLKLLRTKMQMVFQDPFSSLNPRMTVGQIVGEPLVVHKIAKGQELKDRTAEMLTKVGLKPEHANRYPHAFSGGQRQRIGIARALITYPAFVIADEPVSALDVSVQAQVINLLRELQHELGLTYIIVAHDLSVVRHICNRVAVMYAGKIVEMAGVKDVFDNPLHPYTMALMGAVPKLEETVERLPSIAGEPPPLYALPQGCRFAPRCSFRAERCSIEEPSLAQTSDKHWVSCWQHKHEVTEVVNGEQNYGDSSGDSRA